jgi:hypothetical protein
MASSPVKERKLRDLEDRREASLALLVSSLWQKSEGRRGGEGTLAAGESWEPWERALGRKQA